MATTTNLDKFNIHLLTQSQYDSETKSDNDLYLITGSELKDLTFTSTATNKWKSVENVGNIHLHMLFEIETSGGHFGGDVDLHPYDGSECFVAFRMLISGSYVDCNAYLTSDSHIVIDCSGSSASVTSCHGEYIAY